METFWRRLSIPEVAWRAVTTRGERGETFNDPRFSSKRSRGFWFHPVIAERVSRMVG